jgi:hypothetical protein
MVQWDDHQALLESRLKMVDSNLVVFDVGAEPVGSMTTICRVPFRPAWEPRDREIDIE